MIDVNNRQDLIDLFRETGSAHHQVYFATDGVDAEWPLWYANYLQRRLEKPLNFSLTQSKIVQLLVSASDDQEKTAPQADWAEYYADFFLKQLSQMS